MLRVTNKLFMLSVVSPHEIPNKIEDVHFQSLLRLADRAGRHQRQDGLPRPRHQQRERRTCHHHDRRLFRTKNSGDALFGVREQDRRRHLRPERGRRLSLLHRNPGVNVSPPLLSLMLPGQNKVECLSLGSFDSLLKTLAGPTYNLH
jgi:hypothetical protein